MSGKPTYQELEQRVKKLEKEAVEHDLALQETSMELALGLSEVFEALGKIASGDPSVRLPETSELELITKLKHMVNVTGQNLAEIVNLSHEFAVGLAEHFVGEGRKTIIQNHLKALRPGGLCFLQVPNALSPCYRIAFGMRKLLGLWPSHVPEIQYTQF